MKIPFLIFLSLVLSLTMLQAQDKTQHQIGLAAGVNLGLFKDLNFSPLNYHEKGFVSGIHYTHRKNDNVFNTVIDFGVANLRTDASDFFTVEENFLATIRLEYLKKIIQPSGQLSVHLGGQYNSSANFIIWKGFGAYTFNFAHSLGPTAIATYQLNEKQQLQTNLSMPLLTLLVRPPYAGLDKELAQNQYRPLALITNGFVTSVNKYLAFDWSLAYTFELSKRIDLNLKYRVQYQHIFDVHTYTNLKNHLTAGAAIKF